MAVIGSIMMVLTPTTKQMAAIIVVPAIANSKVVQEDIPSEVREMYGLAKEWMKSELQKGKNGSVNNEPKPEEKPAEAKPGG